MKYSGELHKSMLFGSGTLTQITLHNSGRTPLPMVDVFKDFEEGEEVTITVERNERNQEANMPSL